MRDDLDQEQVQSYWFELGGISQKERLSDRLREEAADIWADASNYAENSKAKLLRKWAERLEEEAGSDREEWEQKWKEGEPGVYPDE